MEEQFLDHIRKVQLADPAQKVLLAVSGGLDSMVMLHLFYRAGFQIGVAHVNFQLRGAESDGDETLVRDTCQQLGIPCYTTRFSTAAYADTHKLSIQVAARELRYAWFKDVMLREDYSLLATAHHLNDRLETVLLNLTRGTSLKNIPQRNDHIIRPLLPFSRQQLEGYATQHHLRWRDDSSNAGDDYPRNFIRHHVVPLLRELNPSLEQSFSRVAERLDATRELAARQVDVLRQRHVSVTGDRIAIEKSFAREVTHPTPLLWEFIRSYGFNYDQAAGIMISLDGESGRVFHAPGYTLVIDRTQLIITPRVAGPDAIMITTPDAHAVLGGWQLTLNHHAEARVLADPRVAWLDMAQLVFPLTWRRWREGDFFYPLGMDHSKKVSDFLIDRKISVADKATVTVLESDGRIAWVVGHRIDNRFKITPATREAMQLTLDQYFP